MLSTLFFASKRASSELRIRDPDTSCDDEGHDCTLRSVRVMIPCFLRLAVPLCCPVSVALQGLVLTLCVFFCQGIDEVLLARITTTLLCSTVLSLSYASRTWLGWWRDFPACLATVVMIAI
jgi:hypothetical protein